MPDPSSLIVTEWTDDAVFGLVSFFLDFFATAGRMSDAASYKKLKEDFVSNLSGGTVSEINYVTLVAAVSSSSLRCDGPRLMEF